MRIARLVLAGALVIAAGGCGAGGYGDDSPGDDVVDGGSSGDAGCSLGIAYEPAQPIEGETVTMTATNVSGSGFFEYFWTVNGSDEGLTDAQLDGSAVSYTFTEPGTYAIGLEVTGSSCTRFDDVLSVGALGATDTQWRLRITPPPTSSAPPQEIIRTVPSGADRYLGDLSLDPGDRITGTIRDGSGTAIAAYLRLVPAGTPELAIDAFASASGGYAADVTLVRHDLLIVPYRTDLAPRLLADWTPQSADHTVDAGSEVTGTVVDGNDVGVVGATVTLRVGGVPSSVGVTGAGGAFSLRARPATGAVVEVTVVPPAATGLPRLVSSAAVLDLATPIAVAYQPLVRRDVAGTSATVGGASAGNGEVTFTGSIAAAGVVRNGLTQTGAAGSFALEVAATGGVLASALIPAVAGVAVVEPATGTPGAIAVDLTAAVPATIAAPAAAPVTGTVVGPTGSPVASADLRAIPVGALAAAGVLEVHLSASSEGAFSLPLAAGGSYDLVVRDPRQELAQLRTTWSGGALGNLTLPDGMRLGGRITQSGSGTVIGAAVTLYCASCEIPSVRPDAEAATDAGGRFDATVLDPGTE